jgi:hypothetical protein
MILPCHLRTAVRQRDCPGVTSYRCTFSPKTAKTLTDHYLMSALPPKADIRMQMRPHCFYFPPMTIAQ